MGFAGKKVTVITNFILVAIVAVVSSVTFMPDKISTASSDGVAAPIYNGNRAGNAVSLMFNVYENAEIVNSIIDILNSYGAKATFFVGGCWADDNEQTLKNIVESGNEIANHGYFHKDHKNIGYDGNYNEISKTGIIVQALCGVKPVLFAPPSGSFGKDTLIAADKLGYKVIMWSKDTIDWRDNDGEKIFRRATKNVMPGDFILMHPKKQTLLALSNILEYYSKVGLAVVTVSDNLAQ